MLVPAPLAGNCSPPFLNRSRLWFWSTRSRQGKILFRDTFGELLLSFELGGTRIAAAPCLTCGHIIIIILNININIISHNQRRDWAFTYTLACASISVCCSCHICVACVACGICTNPLEYAHRTSLEVSWGKKGFPH